MSDGISDVVASNRAISYGSRVKWTVSAVTDCWKSAAEPGATPVVVGPVGVVVCSTGGAVSLGAGGSVSGRFLEQPATAMSAVPMMSVVVNLAMRSEERRVGKEWVSTCRSWLLPCH